MKAFLAAVGQVVVNIFRRVGRFGLFSARLLSRLGGARFEQIVRQIHYIGNYSLLIIAVSGLSLIHI